MFTIPTEENTSTVTDMRVDADGLIKDVEKKGMKYIFQKSKPKMVMMNMKLFKKLMEAFEDGLDHELVNEIEKNDNRRKGWHTLQNATKKYSDKL